MAVTKTGCSITIGYTFDLERIRKFSAIGNRKFRESASSKRNHFENDEIEFERDVFILYTL
jgi:hypothetical protein